MEKEETICGRCGMSYQDFIGEGKKKNRGVLCDLEISNGAHTFQVEPAIPSGVSGWEEYGKKYGYWDYFKNKIAPKNTK